MGVRMNTTQLDEEQGVCFADFLTKADDFLASFQKEHQLECVTLWGITLWPIKEDHDLQRKEILLKFLRARNWAVADAEKQFSSTMKWRQEQK